MNRRQLLLGSAAVVAAAVPAAVLPMWPEDIPIHPFPPVIFTRYTWDADTGEMTVEHIPARDVYLERP